MTPAADERADVALAYDRWSSQYDADANATRDLDAVVLRAAALPLSGCDVLEIGCGTGKNTVWLAASARHVTRLDFSPGMLDEARRRVSAANVTFVRHDIRAPWPLGEGAVDLVVGNLVLEHVAQLMPVFAEAARVLRPGGTLFLCELHPYRQLRGGQPHFSDAGSGETVHVPAFSHSTSEFVDAAVANGFVLTSLDEWTEPAAAAGAPPRLLSLHFVLGPTLSPAPR